MTLTLFLKTLLDRWKVTMLWFAVALFMAVIQMSIYPSVVKEAEGMQQFLDSFPDIYMEMFRVEDYTSSAGFLGTELYSMLLPLVFIGIASASGAAMTAGEEERGTADLLFSLPVSRMRILGSKVAAGVFELFFVGVLFYLVILVGSGPAQLDELDYNNLAQATLAAVLLAVLFGALALLAGVLSGRRAAGVGVGIGVGLVAFVFYSLAPIVDTFDFIKPLNPMEWALADAPLRNGWQLDHALKLVALAALLYATAFWQFRKRDLTTQ